jgi:hypothetical protein
MSDGNPAQARYWRKTIVSPALPGVDQHPFFQLRP